MQDCKTSKGRDDSLVTRKRQTFKTNAILLHLNMNISGTRSIRKQQNKMFLTRLFPTYIILWRSTQSKFRCWESSLCSSARVKQYCGHMPKPWLYQDDKYQTRAWAHVLVKSPRKNGKDSGESRIT